MSSQDYAIKRVVLASGTRNGWTRGQYYASNILAGPSKSCWPVKLIMIKAYSIGDLEWPGSPITSDVEEREGSQRASPLLVLRWNRGNRGRVLKVLDEWCSKL